VEKKLKFTYSKAEKLKSKKLFEQLFAEGKSIANYPLRLIYVKTVLKETISIKVGVTVSKRNFKSAVKRNRIKRILRESYRCNKSIVFNNSNNNYALLFLYLGKEMPKSIAVEKKMISLLEKFTEKIGEEIQDSTSVEKN
tara:strand:+ start:125500 stop:125919 length:420 start_codon:yes stop_codon:yes gene_type:complete